MKSKFSAFFNGLKPKQKGLVVMMAIGVVMTVIGVVTYISSGNKQAAEAKAKPVKVAPVEMDSDLMKKNQLLEAQKEAQVAKDTLSEEKKKMEEQLKMIESASAAGLAPPGSATAAEPRSVAVPPPPPPQQASTQKRSGSLPPVPRSSAGALPPPPLPAVASNGAGPAGQPPMAVPQQPTVESEIGGISVTAGVAGKEEKNTDKKKDEKRSVYLPISFMGATLLSGLDAPTSADAKGNPVPVIIRIKTPAVLPNDVKANLHGCFVVADGKGNLGTERAELVLVSLSCLDRKGQAVIDQSLTGYVVDADGKAGLRGRVVTKMGAMITRSMLAGMFGGFGEALNSANTTTSITPIGGSISNIEPDKIGMAGVGKGLSNAFKEVQKFYMELAHQTMPVIEIGAARPLTLVITRGTTLDIKKLKGGK